MRELLQSLCRFYGYSVYPHIQWEKNKKLYRVMSGLNMVVFSVMFAIFLFKKNIETLCYGSFLFVFFISSLLFTSFYIVSALVCKIIKKEGETAKLDMRTIYGMSITPMILCLLCIVAFNASDFRTLESLFYLSFIWSVFLLMLGIKSLYKQKSIKLVVFSALIGIVTFMALSFIIVLLQEIIYSYLMRSQNK